MLTLLSQSLLHSLRSAAIGGLVLTVLALSWAMASPQPDPAMPIHHAR